MSFCYWFLVFPDVARPIGGIKQIHRLAESFRHSGRQVHLIQDSDDFHPGWFNSELPVVSKQRWLQIHQDLDPNSNFVVIPETFAPALERYSFGLPVVIFNQNSSYSFGADSSTRIYKPSVVLKAYHSSQVRHVICVSKYDYDVLRLGFKLPISKLSLIPNAIETELCLPDLPKKKRITYMLRKNRLDAVVVSHLLSSLDTGWSLNPIENVPHSDVLNQLKTSLIFLSFGHPEGFGLPVAEAIACGCAVVGYSGLGGRELFALADTYSTSYEVPFGDWMGFVSGTNHFIRRFSQSRSEFLSQLNSASNRLRQQYSFSEMCRTSLAIVTQIENNVPHS
tara:strand:+ start:100 stop:1110 length:1011 start_codon:yes stop_codon:yes gene_type:complete